MFDEQTPVEVFETSQDDFQMHVTKGEIFKALSEFQGKCEHPKKTATANIQMKSGGAFKYSYATLDNCINANQELLTKCGLSVIQFPITEYGEQLKVGIITVLAHSGGDYMQGRYLIKVEKETAQLLGSAITYLRRYSYCAVLGLAAEDDDDANHASKPGKDSIRNKPDKKEPTKPEPATKQIHTQKAIEDRVKAAGSVEMLTALWIECTLKQQQTDKIKGWFSIRKSQLKDENKSQTNFESDLFPDVVKVIKHINEIESEKHLNNWYKKHLEDIQKLETRDYDLISKTIDNKKQSFNK